MAQITKKEQKQKNALLISWPHSNSLCDNWKKVLYQVRFAFVCVAQRQIDFTWFDCADSFGFLKSKMEERETKSYK